VADVVPISATLRAEREALLARHLEAHNAGDIAAVVRTFTTPRLESVPSGRVVTSGAELTTYLEERRRSFPDQSFELMTIHHADTSVVAEYWMSGTHLGSVNNLEPTGKRMHVRMISVYQFDGADLIGQRVYYDAGTIARQLA
jgi:steroid delta-isomerase-like uncharacterized protein